MIGVLCCMGGLYRACGGLREYIWPANAVHVGVAAQRAENEGGRRCVIYMVIHMVIYMVIWVVIHILIHMVIHILIHIKLDSASWML